MHTTATVVLVLALQCPVTLDGVVRTRPQTYSDNGSVGIEMPRKEGHLTTCCLDPRTYIAGGRYV